MEALGDSRSQLAVHPLLTFAAGDAQDDAWRGAVNGLCNQRAREAVPVLIQNMRALPDTVLDALGRIGDVRAVPPLIRALRYRDRGLRAAAATALGRLGDPSGIAPLQALLGDRWPSVRHAARQAIRHLERVQPRTV